MCSEGDVGKMHGMVIIAEEQTGGKLRRSLHGLIIKYSVFPMLAS